MPKNQGEGDYEAARRYNKHTTEHVEKMDEEELATAAKAGDADIRGVAEARRVGKSKARAGDQDLRDAETFRALREQEDEK